MTRKYAAHFGVKFFVTKIVFGRNATFRLNMYVIYHDVRIWESNR